MSLTTHVLKNYTFLLNSSTLQSQNPSIEDSVISYYDKTEFPDSHTPIPISLSVRPSEQDPWHTVGSQVLNEIGG